MDPFSAYTIPIQGLKTGLHEYQYALDGDFFRHFEGSLIQEGCVQAQVVVDKRPSLIIFAFHLSGYTQTTCDRCMAPIRLPLNDATRQLIVKYGESGEAGEENEEVIFISRETSEIQLAPYLYEFALLALPLTNTYNCQAEAHPPCNQDVLRILQSITAEQPPNPAWESLSGLQ